jgi:hypothetical protein
MSTIAPRVLFDLEQARGKVCNGDWVAASDSLTLTEPATYPSDPSMAPGGA